MVKHNWCAKVGAKYIKMTKKFHSLCQHYPKTACIAHVIFVLEVLLTLYCFVYNARMGTFHHFLEDILTVNLLAFGLYIVIFILFKSYKFSQKMIKRLKVNSYDEYLREKFQK